MKRRDFIKATGTITLAAGVYLTILKPFASAKEEKDWLKGYDWSKHYWGFGIDCTKCIGCGSCVRACKEENDVVKDPYHFRCWVERYVYLKGEEKPKIDSPNGGYDSFPDKYKEEEVSKAFFVPKLCNQCAVPACVQVCPVGATYQTKDGVVLVDNDYCIGCRYCIEACPFGARYMNDETGCADKCTWCYHRITKGLKPACVEACPVEARIFGDLKDKNSDISKFVEKYRVSELKPDMGCEARVEYNGINSEVR